MNAEAQRKVLGLLGLGARARKVVIGVDMVRTAAQRGRLALVVIGSDASKHSRAKVIPLATAQRISIVEGPTVAELGGAVGKDAAAAVGVLDADLARGIRTAAGDAAKAVQEVRS